MYWVLQRLHTDSFFSLSRFVSFRFDFGIVGSMLLGTIEDLCQNDIVEKEKRANESCLRHLNDETASACVDVDKLKLRKRSTYLPHRSEYEWSERTWNECPEMFGKSFEMIQMRYIEKFYKITSSHGVARWQWWRRRRRRWQQWWWWWWW